MTREPAEPSAPARALEGAVSLLERVVPIAAAVHRGVGRLGATAMAAAAVLIYSLLREGVGDGPETGLRALAIVLVLAPAVILLVFWFALRELLEVPGRIRRLPGESREQAAELGRLAGDARGARKARVWRLPAYLLRLASVAGSTRELLTPYAPVLVFISVPFLLSTLFAVLASLVVIVLALVVAIGLLS